MHNPFRGIVYHGSNAVFRKFDQTKARVANDFFGGGVAYFTDSKPIGVQYAKSMSKKTGEPILYTCNLNLRNVFDTEAMYAGRDLVALIPPDTETFARGAGLLKYGTDKISVLSKLRSGATELSGVEIFKGLSGGMNYTAKARQYLVSKGYDGLKYLGGTITGAVKHGVYLAYSASAIDIKNIEVIM